MKFFAHKRKSDDPDTGGGVEPSELSQRLRRSPAPDPVPVGSGEDAETRLHTRYAAPRQPTDGQPTGGQPTGGQRAGAQPAAGDMRAPANPFRDTAPARVADPGATLRGAEPPVRHFRNAANDVGTGQARTISFPPRAEEPDYEVRRGPRLRDDPAVPAGPGEDLVLGRDAGTHRLDADPQAEQPPGQPQMPTQQRTTATSPAAPHISIREEPRPDAAQPTASAPRRAPAPMDQAPVDQASAPAPASRPRSTARRKPPRNGSRRPRSRSRRPPPRASRCPRARCGAAPAAARSATTRCSTAW